MIIFEQKSELEVFTTEKETPKKISHKKETTEIVETQILPSTSKGNFYIHNLLIYFIYIIFIILLFSETEVVTGTPKRTRKSKAASIHGESSVSNLDNITTPLRKTYLLISFFF